MRPQNLQTFFCIFKEEVIHRASDGKGNVIHYFKSVYNIHGDS